MLRPASIPDRRDALRARRPDLLGTALLLAGDRAGAEELVQRALSRSVTRPDRVLRALVQEHVGWRARLTRREQVIESAVQPVPGLGDPEFARALRELPAAARAAVVLRCHVGCSAEEAAGLLGRGVEDVRTWTGQAGRQLTAALPGDGFRRPAAVRTEQQQLRDELEALATAPGGWQLDAGDAVADAVARRRGRLRRRAGALVAAAVLVGVAVPVARQLPQPPPVTAAPAAGTPPSTGPAAPVGSAGVPSTPVLVEPTRGSLADDRAFVEAVRAVGWGGLAAPPADEREVVLATDTDTARVVLVVGSVVGDFRGVWLTGPVGAPASALAPYVPQHLGRSRPAYLAIGDPGDVTVVVVAAPTDEIRVSDRLEVGPRGTTHRGYAPVEQHDGVAVVPARSTTHGSTAQGSTTHGLATSVRVLRSGQPLYRSGVEWPEEPAGRTVEAPPLVPLRDSPGTDPDGRDAVATSALQELAVPLAVEPETLGARLLWSATVPLSGRAGAVTVGVLAGDSPDGGLVLTAWAARGLATSACGAQPLPGDTDLATLTVVRVCPLPLASTDGSEDGVALLVVSAPPAARTAELLDGDGGVLATLPLVGGGTAVPVPDGASLVRTRAADGAALSDVAVPEADPPPFGDYGTGSVR